MNGIERIGRVFSGLLMLISAGLMIVYPDIGYYLVVLLLFLTLTVAGLGNIVYYFTMARYAVGGKRVLYRGLLAFDAGIFALTLSDVPRAYIMLYLIGCHAFSGFVSIMRSREERQYDAPAWKRTLRHGIYNVIIAVVCLFFLQSETLAVYLYASGLIFSGCVRITSAFRRTAIAYIP